MSDWQALLSSASTYYGPTTSFDLYHGSTSISTTVAYLQSVSPANTESFVNSLNNLLQTSDCAGAVVSSSNGGIDMSAAPVCYEKSMQLYSLLGFTVPGTTNPTTPTTTAKIVGDVVMPQIQRATSIQQASIISNVVSNIFSSRAPNAPGAPVRVSLGNQTGMAAGNEAPKLNAWVNVADTTIGSSAAASLFDGKVSNAIGGVDYMVSSNFVAGVSLGYDKVDLNFNFAAGSGLNSSGWMLAPYASYQINDMLSVDGTLGYASGDVDSRSPNRIDTVSYTRDFVALNLNATRWMGDLQFTGKVNYIAANEKVAMTNKMEQVRLSGQVGYWMDGIMPYLSVAYVQDLKVTSGGLTPANLDKDAWVATVGANLFSKGAVYGGIAYTEEFGRTDAKNYTFMANVGYRF
jgi:hypothetical protein